MAIANPDEQRLMEIEERLSLIEDTPINVVKMVSTKYVMDRKLLMLNILIVGINILITFLNK